jgi:hypothetical protein
MQFLLIVAHDDAFVPTEELVGQIMSWIKRMTDQGIRIEGRPLRPAADATTLRIRNGKLYRAASTFSDSAEQMCAFELIECRDLEQAIDVASQHPMATAATIEVRPVWSGLGA